MQVTKERNNTISNKKDLWARTYIIGKLVNIVESKGNMFILTIKDINNNLYKVQAWQYAYGQIFQNQFELGQSISCMAWPSYYQDTQGHQKMFLKTHHIYKAASIMEINGYINSEWLKTKSLGANIHQFTIKDINNNGKIVHCSIPKEHIGMRILEKGKGTLVNIVGTFAISLEEDNSNRLTINVFSMDEMELS